MTVSEFIAWLKTQDQDAIVECVKHDRSGSHYEQGGTAHIVDFAPSLSHYDTRSTYNHNGLTRIAPATLLIGESE